MFSDDIFSGNVCTHFLTDGQKVGSGLSDSSAEYLDKPDIELKAFDKTRLLVLGESETLNFHIAASNFASFYIERNAWIADKGEYQIKMEASSEDIRLKQNFTLDNEIVIEEVHKVLIPKSVGKELRQ